ncbi:MAG: cation transporter [Candidatus Methanoplasma sp.]|jgi:copper chaperone CopZ|nr:cation transporter [Candidatus Methanoplasma sp.]
MRYAYTLENLGCACCAAKMEEAVRKIDGVRSASVVFITARLVIDADERDIGDIERSAAAAIKKIESKVKLKKV